MPKRDLSPVVRRRLEIQGFVDDGDGALCEVEPWLRFSPALCTLLIAAGAALALPALLWALVPVAVLGALLPTHPFDLIYNFGLRRITKTPPLPRNGAPRRFACGMGGLWLTATALAFTAGATGTGYALGGVLTAVGLLVSTTHICIPSMTYRLLTGGLRRGVA